MTDSSERHPGVAADVAPATRDFRLNHCMLRVKDPEVSLACYTHVMGMRVLRKLDFPEMKFSLYFLARLEEEAGAAPQDAGDRTVWTFRQQGILELTHNWGTEDDPAFRYHDGNAQPQGFGHICFAVPDLAAAVRWFDENGVAFVKDPDGYWIEIVQPDLLARQGT